MSNTTATGFHFELSNAELRWLSSAFGITSLPLHDLSLRPLPAAELESILKKGLESLRQRELIRRSETSWQVDRIPAAVIQWIGSAASVLVVDIDRCDMSSDRLQIFTEQDVSLVVEAKGDSYRFLFLPGHTEVIDHLLIYLGALFPDWKSAAEKYSLSQPVTILRTAWADLSLAGKMLEVVGVDPKESKTLLAWAASLKWIATLRRVQFSTDNGALENQIVLCGDMENVWFGQTEGSENLVLLVPSAKKEIWAQIENHINN